MGVPEFILILGGLGVSVIGYFLKQTMQELKDIKKVAYKNATKIQVIETDYLNKIDSLNNRIEMLYKAIDNLTTKIDDLNKNM